VTETLTKGHKVYTIGVDQILRIFRHKAQYNFLIRKKAKNFRSLVPMQTRIRRNNLW